MEPAEIKKLDPVVINRIAAGEIIQRPANALKEMIENSLDAGATNIQITVKDGGLKLLQIQDNGTGIRVDDYRIVCERFTTSKLRQFEDLEAISTYGFRGEALSSISHVAHLNIVSKIQSSEVAYSASYTDGVIIGEPKPLAGNQGTIITVEDLFYNMAVRRGALRSPAEEYAKVSDVVGKYAVHNATVGFSLKKTGDAIDLRTMRNSTVRDNIRVVFGHAVAKELMDFTVKDDAFKFTAEGLVTNLNYTSKKMQLVLFINHRLVECQSMRRRVDQIYATYLPKHTHPFAYVSLAIEPRNVDVNVHPTKHEVHFLNEEQIVDMIGASLEARLLSGKESRTFYAQSKLPVTILNAPSVSRDKDDDYGGGASTSRIYDKDLVRTDGREQKLEKFFGPVGGAGGVRGGGSQKVGEDAVADALKRAERFEENLLEQTVHVEEGPGDQEGKQESNETVPKKVTYSQAKLIGTKSSFIAQKARHPVRLRSVLAMQKAIEDACDPGLRAVIGEHVFVGAASERHALVQHRVRLLLIDTERMMRELFYQCVAYNFHNFHAYRFAGALKLRELALIALHQSDTGWTEADGSREELADNAVAILLQRREMLKVYFEVDIDADGMLLAIPILIDGHTPLESGLPRYILRLACEVQWDDEQPCFESFARETALYYAQPPLTAAAGDPWLHTVEHVLFPFAKEYFLPPTAFKNNGVILEAANLPQLYKVFERC